MSSADPNPAVNPAASAAATPAAAESTHLLDDIIAQGKLARDDEQRALARDLIGEFVDQAMSGQLKVSTDTQAMINARIGQLDALISDQLNAVMHHPDFQALEG